MPESSRTSVRPELSKAERAPGNVEVMHDARLRLPVLGGVLGVEPRLDRVPAGGGGFATQRGSVGDLQLQLHQIQTRGGLGDRVLHLQSGVHLQEEEVARCPSARNSTVPAPV